jgi:hypothetical protein
MPNIWVAPISGGADAGKLVLAIETAPKSENTASALQEPARVRGQLISVPNSSAPMPTAAAQPDHLPWSQSIHGGTGNQTER